MKDINVRIIWKPKGQFKLLCAFAIKVAVMYLRQVVIIVIVSTHNGKYGLLWIQMASAATATVQWYTAT